MAGSLLPQPKQLFQDANWNPLIGGQIFTYAAGTLTPKTTYQDTALTIANTNPTLVDARGEVVMYGSGVYRVILKNIFGITIWDRDNVATPDFASVELKELLTSQLGAAQVGTPKGTVQSQLDILFYGSANVRDPVYAGGADNTGVADCTAAVTAALAAKKGNIHFPDGTYKMLGLSQYTGRVNMSGANVTIRADQECLRFTDAGGSRVSGNIRFENITIPYTIRRNQLTWASNVAADVTQSNEGYQPSALDFDFYPSLSAAIKSQRIGPKLVFTCSSSTGHTDVEISGLSGRFFNIVLEGYSSSTVSGGDIHAGLDYAGIVFYNNTNLARISGAQMDYTFAAGYGNRVFGNTIRWATTCGITFFGNTYFSAVNNWAIGCGETGIKTYQDDTQFGPEIISHQSIIANNFTIQNRYDGIDASATYPTTGTASAHVLVTGNIVTGNRCTGIFSDAQSNQYANNHCLDNGLGGMTIQGANSSVSWNYLENNVRHPGTAGVFNSYDLEVTGDNCDVQGNVVKRNTAPAYTYSMYHSGSGGCNVNNSISHDAYVDPRILLNVVPSTSRTTRVPLAFAAYFISNEPTATQSVVKIWRAVSEGQVIAFFQGPSETPVGSLTVSQTQTFFISTSDYRLKNYVGPITGAWARVKAAKTAAFYYKQDPDVLVNGVLAHELAESHPGAVTGEKDGMQHGPDGVLRPAYQGVDLAKIVPDLLAALQEAQARIEALEAQRA